MLNVQYCHEVFRICLTNVIVDYCLNVIISDHEHFECYSGVIVTKM